MVEVDALWTYAIGAGCALSTAEQLHPLAGDIRRQRGVRDRELTAALLFTGLLFTPMGMWLAVRFPGWETMYAVREMPPWGLGLFSAGITLCTALGYLCVHRLLVDGCLWAACLQLILAYTGVFFVLFHGWDGTGIHRFLASAPQAEFSRALVPSWAEFTTWLCSPVAVTLLVMGLLLIPPLLWLNARAHTRGLRARSDGSASRRQLPGLRAVGHVVLVILGPCLGLALAARLAAAELGVLLGGTLWATAAATVLRPGGALADHCQRIVLPSLHGRDRPGAIPSPPVGPAFAASVSTAPRRP